MKKLKSIFTIFFAFIIITALSTNTFAEGVVREYPVKIGDETLTSEKTYYKDNQLVDYCELGQDNCTLFFPYGEPGGKILYLNNYNGPEIYIETRAYESVYIVLNGNNVINSKNEYGIKIQSGNNSHLYFLTQSNISNLTINVNSSTDNANGIIKNIGDVDISDKINLEININAKIPENEITGSNVTGITIEEDGRITKSEDSTLIINNNSVNFAIFAEEYRSATDLKYCDNKRGETFSPRVCTNHTVFNYKITNGIGDAIEGNDFEINNENGASKIKIKQPIYTAVQTRTETSGTFKVLPSTKGVNAIFNEEIHDGENFEDVETRMRNSLENSLEDLADRCEDYGCGNDFYKIDKDASFLRNITNPDKKDAISIENEYEFVIDFKITDNIHGFPKTLLGPYGDSSINHKNITQQFNLEKLADDRQEIAFKYKLTVSEEQPKPEEPEPEPEEPEQEEPEEIKSEEPEKPKEIQEEKIITEENPKTNTNDIRKYKIIFAVSLVIQLTYSLTKIKNKKGKQC